MNRSQVGTNIQPTESDPAVNRQHSVWEELAMLRCGICEFQRCNQTIQLDSRKSQQNRAALPGKNAVAAAIASLLGRTSKVAQTVGSFVFRTSIGTMGATAQPNSVKPGNGFDKNVDLKPGVVR
jgi:Na+-translocating ferredoxin:NAD+ oxidoreductase RNF subunit RnfB